MVVSAKADGIVAINSVKSMKIDISLKKPLSAFLVGRFVQGDDTGGFSGPLYGDPAGLADGAGVLRAEANRPG